MGFFINNNLFMASEWKNEMPDCWNNVYNSSADFFGSLFTSLFLFFLLYKKNSVPVPVCQAQNNGNAITGISSFHLILMKNLS
jgi:hypothetical protein